MTTPQTSITMKTHFAVVIGKGHKNNWFKPVNCNKYYNKKDQYLYKVYNGLHYYVLYEPRYKTYSLMRTNYKVEGIILSGEFSSDYADDGCNIRNHMRQKMGEEPEGYINEYASWYKDKKYGDNGVDGFTYNNREEKDKEYDYQSRDYTDNELVIIKQLDITKIPDGFLTIGYNGGLGDGSEGITDLWYYAPHLPSITQEYFDNTIEFIFKNAIKDVIVKNTKININCIDGIMEYL